jgi:hypothetical protein
MVLARANGGVRRTLRLLVTNRRFREQAGGHNIPVFRLAPAEGCGRRVYNGLDPRLMHLEQMDHDVAVAQSSAFAHLAAGDDLAAWLAGSCIADRTGDPIRLLFHVDGAAVHRVAS